MIETSIVMTHYAEDEERSKIALRCIQALQAYRNETTEFILVCNGHYKGLEQYADQYFERDVDSSPGRSTNIGFRAAKGNILVTMCNDVLVFGNWLEECKKIVTTYDKYMATPYYYDSRYSYELPVVDGYCVNQRVGANIMMFRRDQYEDIGPCDEVNPIFDGSNYLNRLVDKGYATMMTKEILAKDLAIGVHSYLKQQEEMGYKKLKNVRLTLEQNEKLYKNKKTRNDLAEMFKGVGAEVGVEQGEYSEIICKYATKLYCIDSWKAYHGYRDHTRQSKLDRFYEITKERLKNYNCEIIRKFSQDAVKDFEDESLDFVYIDANHREKYITEDLIEWTKKVKKHGIIAGHDYVKPNDVFNAVNKYTKEQNKLLIVFRGDEIPSWMFFK